VRHLKTRNKAPYRGEVEITRRFRKR